MNSKKIGTIVLQELLANGIGWIAGLLAANLLSHFFIVKKWWNLGGRFSKKTALDANTLNAVEWIATAVIGFIVLTLVNRLIKSMMNAKKTAKT